MKKLAIILGLLAMVGITAIGWFIVQAVRSASEVDASSKAFVDAAVPAIAAAWAPDELIKRSSPELRAASSRKDVDQLFGKLSELGPLKEYHSEKGQMLMLYTSAEGARTTINYTVHAICENEKADIELKLIRRSGDWKILSFHVNSPIFLRKSEISGAKETSGAPPEKKPEPSEVKE